jgi:hypothetical protein
MNNLPNIPTPLTYEILMASIYENDRLIKEKFAETDRILTEKFAETDRRFKETERLVKANCREIGGISKSNGDAAEAYFYNSFKKHPHFAGQDYQFVEQKVLRHSKALNLEDEFDLVLYNGTSVVIIEVKYNAKKEDIEQVLKKVDTFKKLRPQYKDYTFYLGLAGLNVYKNAEKEAQKQGVAVIKQMGKKVVINDAHLKAF